MVASGPATLIGDFRWLDPVQRRERKISAKVPGGSNREVATHVGQEVGVAVGKSRCTVLYCFRTEREVGAFEFSTAVTSDIHD